MNNSTFNARRVPNVGVSQGYKSQAVAPTKPQSAKWEIVRQDYVEPLPSQSGTANNLYQKPIPLDTTDERAKRLTIRISEEEYVWLQKLYDLVGYKFNSLDDMLRQMILQPEMRYKFLEFLSWNAGNDAIDYVIQNQPSGFGWV